MGDFLLITFQKFENKWIINNLFRELHYPLNKHCPGLEFLKKGATHENGIPAPKNALVPCSPVPDATGDHKPISSHDRRGANLSPMYCQRLCYLKSGSGTCLTLDLVRNAELGKIPNLLNQNRHFSKVMLLHMKLWEALFWLKGSQWRILWNSSKNP